MWKMTFPSIMIDKIKKKKPSFTIGLENILRYDNFVISSTDKKASDCLQ